MTIKNYVRVKVKIPTSRAQTAREMGHPIRALLLGGLYAALKRRSSTINSYSPINPYSPINAYSGRPLKK
jgi:hypothetical protein